MLDETHPQLPNAPGDWNNYILGSVGPHKIVITCLSAGVYGTTLATTTATQMRFSYASIQWCLLVGIGGGAGTSGTKPDIRLGDVVVSEPMMNYPGVIQYDYGKAVQGGDFVRTGTLDKPPEVLLKALARLKAQHMVHGSTAHLIHQQALSKHPNLREEFSHPGPQEDRLFVSGYHHEDASVLTCDHCDPEKLQHRNIRPDSYTRVFYGLIASANQVIKDSKLRDQLSQRYGILCFEMEAAGVMNVLPSLVIRGVCDYSDSHKSKRWQGYAAMAAAAYAKELILFMPLFDVANAVPVEIIPTQSTLKKDAVEVKEHLTPVPMLDRPIMPIDILAGSLVAGLISDTYERSTKSNQASSDPKRDKESPAVDQPRIKQSYSSRYRAESDSDGTLKVGSNIPSNHESHEHNILHLSESVNKKDIDVESLLERLKPETDPQDILDIRLSMTCKEGTWHPWPGDCVGIYHALDDWLKNGSSPLVVAPASGPHIRVKDLAVEVIGFLTRWKKGHGSNYEVLWALGLNHPDRPKDELLKSLIASISKAYPEVFRQTISQVEIKSQIEVDEDGLWVLLRLLISRITNAFIIVDPEDQQFLLRILKIAGECYNNEDTRGKVRFFIVFNGVEIQYRGVVKVPPLPPQARMRGLVRGSLSWKLFRSGF